MVDIVWVILKSENHFLLIQRSLNDVAGGTWCFPGGKIDPDDNTPVDAAARELKEETGLIGHSFRLLCNLRRDKYPTQVISCDKWGGELDLSCKDIMGAGWFTIFEIHAMTLSLSPWISRSLMHISYLIHNYDTNIYQKENRDVDV